MTPPVASQSCTKSLLFSLAIAAVAIMLSGCNCAEGGDSNSCFEDHCPTNANPKVCKENGNRDGDCCAMLGDASCDDGFSIRDTGGSRCHFNGAMTTCCVPDDENGDGVADYHAPSPRWWFLILGFSFGFCYCFAFCWGCVYDGPLKKQQNRGQERKKLWRYVIVACFVAATCYHFGLARNTNTGEESQALKWLGLIGDVSGAIVACGVFCVVCKPRLEAALDAGEELSPILLLPQVKRAQVANKSPQPQAQAVTVEPAQLQSSKTAVASPSIDSTEIDLESNSQLEEAMEDNKVSNSSTFAATIVGSSQPVSEMAKTFERELPIKGDTIAEVVEKACEALGICTKGLGVQQQAEKCYEVLTGSSITALQCSAPVVVGCPVQVEPPVSKDTE